MPSFPGQLLEIDRQSLSKIRVYHSLRWWIWLSINTHMCFTRGYSSTRRWWVEIFQTTFPSTALPLLSVCISNTTVCHAILQFWYWLRVGLIKVVIGEKVSQHEAMQCWVMVLVRFKLHQPTKLKGQNRHSISFLWLSLHSLVSLTLCSQHTLLQSISDYSFISRRLVNN